MDQSLKMLPSAAVNNSLVMKRKGSEGFRELKAMKHWLIGEYIGQTPVFRIQKYSLRIRIHDMKIRT